MPGQGPQSLPYDSQRRLRAGDYLQLCVLGLALFGYCCISGKPLTMHEARLPQCAREMLQTGRWLFPFSGERPWLERPPFPHWVELVVAHAAGRLDAEWIARIPPALVGLLTLLLVAWTAARLLGRVTGMLGAVCLATMYEFCFYAGQAEDDIFLAMLVTAAVALFVAIEFPAAETEGDRRTHFLGGRPWQTWAFFAVLGLTNLAKGPLVGAVEVCGAAGAFLLLTRDLVRVRRYVWGWGWVIFLVLGLAWPVAAYRTFPGAWENWKYDYVGGFGHEPPWYYLWALLWTTLPWTPVMLLGLAKVWREARRTAKQGGVSFAPSPLVGEGGRYSGRVGGKAPKGERPAVGVEGSTSSYHRDSQVASTLTPQPAASPPPSPARGEGADETPTEGTRWVDGDLAAKFLCCWALVPLLILSLQARKHHHYLVPVLPAWGLLAGVGARAAAAWLFRRTARRSAVLMRVLLVGLPGLVALGLAARFGKIIGPTAWVGVLGVAWIAAVWGVSRGVARRDGQMVMSWLIAAIVVVVAWGQSVLGTADTLRWGDVPLARRVEDEVQPGVPVYVDARSGMDFFRFQFYVRTDTRVLQNLTFLRDRRITSPEVYVICRYGLRGFLERELGECEMIDRSTRTHYEQSPEDRWTLFRVRFRADLVRYAAPEISVLQAMQRGTGEQAGPFCGPPMAGGAAMREE